MAVRPTEPAALHSVFRNRFSKGLPPQRFRALAKLSPSRVIASHARMIPERSYFNRQGRLPHRPGLVTGPLVASVRSEIAAGFHSCEHEAVNRQGPQHHQQAGALHTLRDPEGAVRSRGSACSAAACRRYRNRSAPTLAHSQVGEVLPSPGAPVAPIPLACPTNFHGPAQGGTRPSSLSRSAGSDPPWEFQEILAALRAVRSR
jgi:hypothetical protein